MCAGLFLTGNNASAFLGDQCCIQKFAKLNVYRLEKCEPVVVVVVVVVVDVVVVVVVVVAVFVWCCCRCCFGFTQSDPFVQDLGRKWCINFASELQNGENRVESRNLSEIHQRI